MKEEEGERVYSDSSQKSGIQFFQRHPLDSRNPLTFLDGGSGSGGGEGVEGSDGGDDDGDDEKKERVSSPHSFEISASPPRDIIPRAVARDASGVAESHHDPLAGFERLDLPQAAVTDRRPRRTTWEQVDREVMLIRARPVALYEMPGRYRSVESC